MEFSGFTQEQFEVFEIGSFTDRMAAIRATVRPTLLALGKDLRGPLSELVGRPLFPHVALHARRKVNPPDDTWVAFGPAERGYKAYAHFAVGIRATGIYMGLVIKDESGDRQTLGRQILDNPDRMLKLWRRLRGYTIEELGLQNASRLDRDGLCKLGEGLFNRKTSTLHLSRNFPRSDSRLSQPEEFIQLAQTTIGALLPLYRQATGGL